MEGTNMQIMTAMVYGQPRRHWVADSEGRKLYPATGYQTYGCCVEWVKQSAHQDRDLDAAWLEFQILASVRDLSRLQPGHYLVKAIADKIEADNVSGSG